jgi:DNA-binding NarL/FixJ family response regulator
MITEDHELTRYGLSLALEEKSHLKIVSEAENGEQAVSLASELLPDVVLMDIGMPVMDGIEATKRIKKEHPEIKVLMLTSHDDEDEVFASLAAGADAYCMKDVKVDRLCQVIEMVQEGAVWLDPSIARMVLHALPNKASDSHKLGSSGGSGRKKLNTNLTDRELEVLELIVGGKSNKEIARILHVTTHTAKAHVCNIMHKLAVEDRTQAAVKALNQGLIDLNQ